MKKMILPAALLTLVCACSGSRGVGVDTSRIAAETGDYFPGPEGEEWVARDAEVLGMDAERLREAVEFAMANEAETPTDLRGCLEGRFGDLAHQEILGPMKDRGPMAGMVLRHGYIVAEWGDTQRVDMTFSVTKSFLATVAGLALDRGLIGDVQDRVADSVDDPGYTSPHNAPITWHMMLRQTNEWEGTLWGKPDTADRREGIDRELQAPGTFWEYNDVRVNRTALSLLWVWREALPEVLARELMGPIGASSTWQWHGYENSWVEVDGKPVQSVSGGGHWGGGMWISTRDLARFGYLHLRQGKWQGRQLLSQDWVERIREPEPLNPSYGYMWWLNTGSLQWPSLPEGSFGALGGGDNTVWIDPVTDLVVVVRWIARPAQEEFLRRVRDSVVDNTVVDNTVVDN
jgi:CubicO group peptidase (beta-lactamase class C family)